MGSRSKYELLWSRQESGVELETAEWLGHMDVTVDEFLVGGVLEASHGRWRGFITGLLGATLISPDGADSEVLFSISIGAGFKYFLLKNVALRGDVRGYCNIVESDSSFISTGGVTVVHFSGSTLWQGEVSAGITVAF
jgi:hypothetical protein